MEPPPGLWRNVALTNGGLSGATIRTIQIAGPATHARYAGWSKWHVRKLSRCLLIGRSNDACRLLLVQLIFCSRTGRAIMVTPHRNRASRSASRTQRSAPRSPPRGTDAETTVAVLTQEFSEALEQQTATSEVLKVVSQSGVGQTGCYSGAYLSRRFRFHLPSAGRPLPDGSFVWDTAGVQRFSDTQPYRA